MPEAIPFPSSAARLERRRILNDTTIRSLRPPATGRVDYFDDLTPGLSLRVTANNARAWMVFYRNKNGRQKRLTLGRYPAVKLVDARELAREAQRKVAHGGDPRALALWQVLQDVSKLVDVTAVKKRGRSKRLCHRFVQCLRAIEDHEETAVGAQPAALEIRQEALAHRGILGRPIPETQRVFAARVVDAERDHDAVLRDVDAVDQQRGEVEDIERGRSPSRELRRGLSHEPAAHRAFAHAARRHRRRQRFELRAY